MYNSFTAGTNRQSGKIQHRITMNGRDELAQKSIHAMCYTRPTI